MKHVLFASMALALAVCGSAQQTWQIQNGSINARFEAASFKYDGLKIENQRGLKNPLTAMQESNWTMRAGEETLQVQSVHSLLDRFETGEAQAFGGFDFVSGKNRISLNNFRVVPQRETPSTTFSIIDESGFTVMIGKTPRVIFTPEDRTLGIYGMDLYLTPDAAKRLGKPALASVFLGSMDVTGTIVRTGGLVSDPYPTSDEPMRGGPSLDVSICRMQSLQQVGREQIGGVWYYAFGILTTSFNVGTAAIPWRTPGSSLGYNMSPQHPVIGSNIFRVNGGKFEQIAEGWLKHGWLSTNSNECATSACANPGGGSALGLLCTDTYGVGNNTQFNYLGPKSEVNAYTGQWTAEGSWFSQGANDRVRRITDSQRRDPVTNATSGYSWTPTQHRLRATEADLSLADSTFVYEGFYMNGLVHTANSTSSQILSQQDVNKYNDYAYRAVTRTKSGSGSTATFSFSSGTFVQGPAIHSWGDSRVILQPNSVGDVITAVKTTDVGGGWYLYDYSVYNMNLDRQMDAFFISVADSVDVRNITFRDVDQDGTNQWNMERSNGNVRWAMQAGAPNPLSYARLFNFRFEAQVAPGPGFAQGDMIKAGDFPWLTSAVTGPTPSQQAISGTLTIPGRGDIAATTVDLRLRPVGGGADVILEDVAVNMPAGTYSAMTTLRGQYDVAIQGAPFLRKGISPTVNIGPDGVTGVNATLISGDIDGSNEIDAADIDAAIAAFGSTDPTAADVDGSGEVDAADIDVVIGSFGAVGDL